LAPPVVVWVSAVFGLGLVRYVVAWVDCGAGLAAL